MEHLKKEEDFEQIIKKGKVVVDFYATWCGPCQLLGPVIEEVAKEEKGIQFVKVDIDQFMNLTRKYKILSVPTIMVFEDGKLIHTHSGYLDKQELKDLFQ